MATLQTITGGGSFTRQNISQINSNFAALNTVDLWVRPQGPNARNTNPGTYEAPLASMAGTSGLLKSGMVVGIEGVLFEEFSSPRVNDVTLVGMGNLPRQATTSGIPNGGGATWLSPTSGTSNLLQPNGQGWRIQNIFFNNSATGATTGCIKLVNAGDPPTSNCSEKTTVIGCILTGAANGIHAVDLPNNILIDGCTFFGFSGSGDLGIASATGLGTGTLNNWVIQNCDFQGNAGHITAPLTSATIRRCKFSYIYGSVTSTTQLVLTSGSNNSIYDCHFDIPYNTNGITAMFALGTNDRFGPNSFATAVTTTIFGFGSPSS